MSLDTSTLHLQHQILDLSVSGGTTISGSEAREIIEDFMFNAMQGAGTVTITYTDIPAPGIITISGTASDDHATLNNLDFASANHTDFVSTNTSQSITAIKTFDNNQRIDPSGQTYGLSIGTTAIGDGFGSKYRLNVAYLHSPTGDYIGIPISVDDTDDRFNWSTGIRVEVEGRGSEADPWGGGDTYGLLGGIFSRATQYSSTKGTNQTVGVWGEATSWTNYNANLPEMYGIYGRAYPIGPTASYVITHAAGVLATTGTFNGGSLLCRVTNFSALKAR